MWCLKRFIKKCHFSFIVFFPLPFISLISPSPTPTPSNHHTLVHESFFLFAQSLHLLPSPPLSCHPALYESVFILLVSSVCSLDSTYEWNDMVFVFLWLAYSLSIMFSRPIHTVAKVKLSSFYGQVVFHCIDVP